MQDGVNANRDGMLTLDSAYNFARFLSGDAEAAEHIVQAAFLRGDGEIGKKPDPDVEGRAELLSDMADHPAATRSAK
jgi:DNA-directed RNA polymerase specialized sigma24 family protein